uniref:Kinetochore protein NDC80 n=1 Tax=Phallusia mammillata TaxID=59560 RepID=A0A6F9DM81_9ASCI|nr:kinetochore protein NDC80 homolog [Phallusia mammillata]
MSKQRKTSFNQASRESVPGTSSSSSARKISMRGTPLVRPSLGKQSHSAAKGSRGSMHMAQSEHHIMKDTRPISDKAFIKKSILSLLHLLESLNYQNPVYAKMLNPPTNRDYQRIFEFLVSHVLGSYSLIGKPDEEMLRVVKDLGYPYSISKSALNNVGTMSAWPHALGLLSWISELVMYVCQEEGSEPFSDEPRKMMKFNYVYKSYEMFMRGTDGPYDELNSQVKRQLATLNATASAEVKDLFSSNAKLSNEYQVKMNEKESNEHLTDEIVTQKNNVEKMNEYLSKVDTYVAQIKDKSLRLQTEIDENQELLNNTKEAIAKIKTTISLQTISPTDAERLVREIKELERSATADSQRLQTLKEEQWDREIKFGKLINEMETFVHKHNSEIAKLHDTLPRVCENMSLESLGRPADEECHLVSGHNGVEENNTRLMKSILPYLKAINKEFVEIQGSQKQGLNNHMKRILQDKEVLDDLEISKKSCQASLNKITKDIETAQKESNKRESAIETELERKKLQLEQVKLARIDHRDREVLKKKQQDLEEFRSTTQQKEMEYTQCLVKMAKRFKEQQDKLEQLVDRFDKSVDDIEESFKSTMHSHQTKMVEPDSEIAALSDFVGQVQVENAG